MSSISTKFRGKLKSYFIKRLGAFEYKRGWMKCDCPICGKKLKFGINVAMNRTHCFVCEYDKNPFQLLMELENLTQSSEVFKLLSGDGYEDLYVKEEVFELKDNLNFNLPEGFIPIDMGDSMFGKSARSYLTGRGFHIPTLASKGWGYCTTGKYMGYVIIPFTSMGKLVYFNARRYLSHGPRFNNPTIDVTGVGKNVIWYNVDALIMYRWVYITEGAMNAETMGDKAISSGGKAISAYQINLLIKSPVERFIILLDPDAKDKAIQLALSLVDFKMVKVVFFPEGEDPNSLGKNKTMQYIYKTKYQNRRDLMALKNNL